MSTQEPQDLIDLRWRQERWRTTIRQHLHGCQEAFVPGSDQRELPSEPQLRQVAAELLHDHESLLAELEQWNAREAVGQLAAATSAARQDWRSSATKALERTYAWKELPEELDLSSEQNHATSINLRSALMLLDAASAAQQPPV